MVKLKFPQADSAVLFSGGLDSAVLLHLVKAQVTKARVAAFFQDFGQESAQRQRSFVQATCNRLGIPLHVLDAPHLVDVVLGTEGPPHIMQTEHAVGGVHIMGSVGGKMLVATIAMRLGYTHIYHGLTASDSLRWPGIDQLARLKAENALLAASSAKPIAVSSEPFLENGLSDSDVVELGLSEGVDVTATWSCLWGNRFHCGQCASCLKRKRVFKGLKTTDKTEYLSTQQDFTTRFLEPKVEAQKPKGTSKKSR
jgi:7-cyano-7-deazaguanine synthase